MPEVEVSIRASITTSDTQPTHTSPLITHSLSPITFTNATGELLLIIVSVMFPLRVSRTVPSILRPLTGTYSYLLTHLPLTKITHCGYVVPPRRALHYPQGYVYTAPVLVAQARTAGGAPPAAALTAAAGGAPAPPAAAAVAVVVPPRGPPPLDFMEVTLRSLASHTPALLTSLRQQVGGPPGGD